MSEYTLVIVESPSKCKKIEQYLNNISASNNTSAINYKCIASYGHIREIAGLEAIDILNNFAPTFIECEGKKEQIKKIKKAIKEASEVILAADDDREGEAIAWHLCQVFDLSLERTKRIVFHEITEPALRQAMETPGHINMAIVNAQIARQVLDMLVGYRLSPLLWKHVKDSLSAGRCQTPALRLIYDNQREIDAAPGKQSYVVTGYFTNKTIPFILNHEETDENKLRAFLEESRTYAHSYKEPKLRTKTSAAPLPFSTSTLQQTASNELHLSPKETMALCQTLYEGGHITYHRTDSQAYCALFKTNLGLYIEKTYGTNYLANDNDKDNGKEVSAHEAIRPTAIEKESVEGDTVNTRENRLYKLIRRRTLESGMAAATISVLMASISAPTPCEYQYTAEQIIFAGWQLVDGGDKTTSKEYTYLQTLKPNILLPPQKIKAHVHLTETKQHYSEAKLVSLLEAKGIGRPSTFSSLIDKIQERKYVKKENVKGKKVLCKEFEVADGLLKTVQTEREFGNEKNKLVITPVGILALEFLLKHFEPFFQYAYTKQMEDDLDLVVKGEVVWHEVCKKYYKELENLSSSITDRGKETIRIDAEHTYLIGKYGPVIKYVPKAIDVSKAIAEPTKGAKDKKGVKEKKGKKEKIIFKAVRPDLDLNKLRQGGYTLAEVLLIEAPKEAQPLIEDALEQNSIGLYLDKPVYIKVGKFGKYLEWNGMNKSLKHLKQPVAEITMEDVAELLFDSDNEKEQTRILSPDASIRKGKYGHYIYYKNKKMQKPRFLKLDGFTGGDYMTCDLQVIQDWFTKTYL
jgi:DNA topoisomerase-1